MVDIETDFVENAQTRRGQYLEDVVSLTCWLSILKWILLRILKREEGNTWMLCFLLVGSPSHRHPAALAWVWSPFLMLPTKNLNMFHGK